MLENSITVSRHEGISLPGNFNGRFLLILNWQKPILEIQIKVSSQLFFSNS